MITSAIAFLAVYMLTWPAFISLLILGILFEHNGAHGWAVFSAITTMVVSYFFFGIPLTTVLLGAFTYVVIGIVWSFYRYKRYVNDIIIEHKDSSKSMKEAVLSRIHPREMLSTITAWILIWPFSLVENFVGDIITGIQLLVQKVFRKVYHKIYDSAVSQLSE